MKPRAIANMLDISFSAALDLYYAEQRFERNPRRGKGSGRIGQKVKRKNARSRTRRKPRGFDHSRPGT